MNASVNNSELTSPQGPSAPRAIRVSKNGKWQSFPKIPCLLQYVPSSVYFARVKINSKINWQSLGTDAWSTAKLRLADFIKEKRTRRQTLAKNFAEAAELFKEKIRNDISLKPRSRDYRMLCIEKLRSTWPDLWNRRLDQITESECEAWAGRLHGQIASQYFNNVVGTLRLIMDAGIRDHVSGGVLAMKTYGHLRNEHSREMAEKVRF